MFINEEKPSVGQATTVARSICSAAVWESDGEGGQVVLENAGSRTRSRD
jgi:hypothetical protein